MTTILYFFWDGFGGAAIAAPQQLCAELVSGPRYLGQIVSGPRYSATIQSGPAYSGQINAGCQDA